MLKASEADHLGNLTFAGDVHLIVSSSFKLLKTQVGAFAYAAVKVKRSFDIVHGEVGTQSDTFGRNDIAQLLALGARKRGGCWWNLASRRQEDGASLGRLAPGDAPTPSVAAAPLMPASG